MPDPTPSSVRPQGPVPFDGLGDATLEIRPWPDPVIDELGHDLRSHYVERFWLGILGPSTCGISVVSPCVLSAVSR